MYTLRSTSRLPPQKVILTATQNKMQLIELIYKDIITHSHLLIFMSKKLVITGADPVPVEINPGSIIIHRQDMKTMQEEADTMIMQQVTDVSSKKHSLQTTQMFCTASSFLLQRRHTSFNVCPNGFTHSWLLNDRHQCHC